MVFLNAFTDLGHKIIIQNTVFKIYDGQTQIILTAIVNALILLPFILLFSPSGFLSDKFSKSKIMRYAAWAAVIITLGITLCYYAGAFEMAFFLTFVLAAQSAIYSPAKYGYIKELVGNDHLTMGNGIVQAVTTVSILGGIFAYSIFFEALLSGKEYADSSAILRIIAPIGWALVLGSIAELVLAYKLPDTGIYSDISFDMKKYLRGEYLSRNMRSIRSDSIIFHSIIGLALFWSISQVVLASFPAYAKESLAIDNTVLVQGMMALAGIGIVIGSMISGKVSKNYIETGTIPLGALGITVSLLFLSSLSDLFWHGVNFFAFGFFAGLFIVPLNALIQFNAPKNELGLVIAGNNFVQNVAMFSFLLLTVVFAYFGLQSLGLFYLMLLVAFVGSVYVIRSIPQSMVIFLIASLISRRIKINVLGLNSFPQKGGVLLLGNHISWLDWAIIQMSLPRQVRFVMDRDIYEKWYLKVFLDFFKVIPISPRGAKEASGRVKALLDAGEVVCLFPEGSISRTGQLAEFKRGFERMVKGADAVIVPFYLQGMWGSRFSRSAENSRHSSKGRKREVVVSFSSPMDISSSAYQVKQKVFELSYVSWEYYSQGLPSLPEAWIDTATRLRNKLCLADFKEQRYSYTQALSEMILVSGHIKRFAEQNIGIMLPPGPLAAIMNMACLMTGKRVVNLNCSASMEECHAVIRKGEIKRVYTSKKVITELMAKENKGETQFDICERIYSEELIKSFSGIKRFFTYLYVKLSPSFLLKLTCIKSVSGEDAAAIVFSLDTGNEPKGIMLTHKNFMGNIKQMADVLNMRSEDRILASLPLHHPFGLTTTMLLPLIEGKALICPSNPMDARGIGRSVAKSNVSVIFSTPALYELYAQTTDIHPLMFDSLRIAVSGMEKLDPKTAHMFKAKFHRQIFESYGVKESTAIASMNLPDILETEGFTVQVGTEQGSVGLPLPGSAFKIVHPETKEECGINENGRILIGGPQVMKGYFKDEHKNTETMLQRDEQTNWYLTDDWGHIDDNGYLFIVQR